ncbi:MAG: non-ribosomal peptide synthetase [Verrucomicrobia bacterium]|nr:MAG: non-ribosomal peptide synthetase [Verrucomicrobiota bacterium]
MTVRNELPLSRRELSDSQKALLLCRIPVAGDKVCALNLTALERSLNEIIRRHEVLRANFIASDGNPAQTIAGNRTLKLQATDLSRVPGGRREEELRRALEAEARKPFDLSGDLLLRALLIQLEANEHVLQITMHHIVSDGWSIGVLFRELAALYDSFRSGTPPALPELPIQYTDYALWERDSLRGAALERQLAYWRKQLSGTLPILDLPTDRPRPAVQSLRGATETLQLPPALTQALKNLSRQEGVTFFMTLLAALQTLLHRYTHQEDILVGSVVAGRNQLDLENLIGFFVNTLVFRGDLAGNPTFRGLLRRVREDALSAFAHQDLPFEKLVQELQPERTLSRNPLFQVMFVLQNAPMAPGQLPGLQLQPIDVDCGTAKFDLTLSLMETPQGLRAALEYNLDLFERETIARMLGHFQTLLEAIAADPGQPLSNLPLLKMAERRQLLVEWNNTSTAYPRNKTIPQLFEEQVARTPDAVAVEFTNRQWTYRELDARANQLANFLREHGVGPDVLVGICMERSLEMVVALVGILKAGGAYVSLDPTYPKERLAFMLEDTRTPVLLTQERLRAAMNELVGAPQSGTTWRIPLVVCPDSDRESVARRSTTGPSPGVRPDNLAYVSYTSGSTGRPKGVCVTHRGVVRLVKGTDFARFDAGDVFLQFAPVAFDASTLEIWGPLLNGGRLVVFPPDAPSLTELGEVIQKHKITTLWLTAGLFHQIVEEQLDCLKEVRQLLAGGDVLSVPHVARALEKLGRTHLINGYGPTENTTFTCCHRISPPVPGDRSIPIGRPVANTQVYVLDRYLQPVPIGVAGELYVGGDGLARNYLNRPELTAEKFVPHPFTNEAGACLYRTGDRTRWLPDGSIEFLGRMDRQVKIRGFRIELEAVETVLSQHPAVKEALALAQGDRPGEKRLVAYVVAAQQPAPSPAELRHFLRQKLPDYMVPSAFVFLGAFPLNANGKVDRQALPDPDSSRTAPELDFAAPRDEVEAELAALWEKVLGVHPIGIRDNFFELGGHSMLGVRLFAQMEKHFGKKLPLASLFQAPTVEQLAALLREKKTLSSCSSLVSIQPKGIKPPIFFVHGAGGGNLWTYANLAPHLGPSQPVYGLESRGMRGLEEFTRIEDMAAHYIEEIRTVQPRGPYYLSGYCLGGNVAYEIARQLHEQGEPVALLALLESTPANTSYERVPWWRPRFLFDFTINAVHWLNSFADLDPAERRSLVRRKFRTLMKKLRQRFGRNNAGPAAIDLEDVIDVSQFPEIELKLWEAHMRAIRDYVPKPYPGRVTLFRTRGQPFLCSFDAQYGWGELAAGGVEVILIPGSHEKIFVEPHARMLATKLSACLNEAQWRRKKEFGPGSL